jgi:hypothetical protein
MKTELQHIFADHFIALILDNEVTVGEFVTDPPLPWVRLVQNGDIFRVANGYPTVLTAAQAKFEMKNWDDVSLPAIQRALADLDGTVDYVLFGNNAGQGLALAQCLTPSLIGARAAIVYAQSLPEKAAYEQLGYRAFVKRSEASSHLLALAKKAGRPLSLCLINTIQHNQLNYHDP